MKSQLLGSASRANKPRETQSTMRITNVVLKADQWSSLNKLPVAALRISIEDGNGNEAYVIYSHEDARLMANQIIAMLDEWEEKN